MCGLSPLEVRTPMKVIPGVLSALLANLSRFSLLRCWENPQVRTVDYEAEGDSSAVSPGSLPALPAGNPCRLSKYSFIVRTTIKRAEKTEAWRLLPWQYENFLHLTASTVFFKPVLKVIHHGTISSSTMDFIICKWFPTRQVVCKDWELSFPFIDLIRK